MLKTNYILFLYLLRLVASIYGQEEAKKPEPDPEPFQCQCPDPDPSPNRNNRNQYKDRGVEIDDPECCIKNEEEIAEMVIEMQIEDADRVWGQHWRNISCFKSRVLYPFGLECDDKELSRDLTRSPAIELGFYVKILGNRFDHIWVHQHGFISFQESFYGISLPHEDWPHPMYPYVDDPVMLAPFYAPTDLAGDKTEDVITDNYGRVLYKVIHRKPLPMIYTEEERFIYEITMKLLDEAQVSKTFKYSMAIMFIVI